MKNIGTDKEAEALLDMYSRVGVPEEVLSDLGTQFTSNCMREVSKLLSIRRLTTSPYHPACNGLAENFNGTLKRMLRRLCHEQPRHWHRFINPFLFAYREARQEATGFSLLEVLYGRTVRGPIQILKELWSEEEKVPEVSNKLPACLGAAVKVGRDNEVGSSRTRKDRKEPRRNKNLYNRKATKRSFQEGDKVLVLLPLTKPSFLRNGKVRSRSREPNGETITRSKSTRK